MRKRKLNTSVKPFITFGKPDITEAEEKAVLEVIRSGWLSTGKKVKEFEEAFAHAVGVDEAVAVSSCTDGLILSLIAAGVGYGHEVITSPLTFAATANAIIAVGAKPVFVDVMPYGGMNPKNIEEFITHKTRAILPVHYTGQVCDMTSIIKIAKQYNLWVVEDCAHMFGGDYKPKGDFASYSFYPTKNITSGEGGMVVTKVAKDAELIRILSMQGLSAGSHERYGTKKPGSYSVIAPGRKSNMSDLHAAIGLTQVKRWPEIKEKRDIVWNVYEKQSWPRPKGHSHHLFTIWNEHREDLRDFLHKKGIGTGIHFSPLHLEPGFNFLGYKHGDFPEAEKIGKGTLSLPVSSTMSKEDAEYVWESVQSYRGTAWNYK